MKTTPRRAPSNRPAVGDRCRLRSKEATGVVLSINPENNWTWVDWDLQWIGPKIVHLFELEKI